MQNVNSGFSGNELQIRATKNIRVGEEVTLCYVTASYARSDYETRRSELKKHWNIDCKCTLCQKGATGPSGDLRTDIMKLAQESNLGLGVVPALYATQCHTTAERLISNLKSYGFDYGSPWMRELHQVVSHQSFLFDVLRYMPCSTPQPILTYRNPDCHEGLLGKEAGIRCSQVRSSNSVHD